MASKQTRKPEEGFSLADIRNLAKIVNSCDLTELEIERKDERIKIRRELSAGGGAAAVAMQPAPSQVAPVAAPAPPPAEAPAAVAGEEPREDGTVLITSPFVGTFYRAPSPESPPFVDVDQRITKGTTLCIVEAMKLMNEIEAEMDCKIVEALAKNAEPVEFGQALFRVLPA